MNDSGDKARIRTTIRNKHILGLDKIENFRKGISFKLLGAILALSLAVTIIATGIRSYQSYQDHIHNLNEQMKYIEKSYVPSLTSSLWEMDKKQIQIQLEGILRLPYMQYAAVFSEDMKEIATVGSPKLADSIVNRFNLLYKYSGQDVKLGSFLVIADTRPVKKLIWKELYFTLLAEGFKILFLAFFILFITYLLITRHLLAMAAYTRQLDIRGNYAPLVLYRRSSVRRQKDEIDEVVSGLNDVLRNLKESFEQITQNNMVLEKEIIEHKRTEEALRKTEERYRALFTRARDGIFLLSGKGELIEVNESFTRMHGYSMQEMLHINLKDLDTPETFQGAPERMRRLWAGEALTFEVEHYHKDGHVFPLEVSASLISFGGESCIQCFHRDITERRRAQETLARLKQQDELILSSAAEGIMGLDLQGNHIFVNPAAARMLGYEAEELLNRPSHSTWHHTKPDGTPYPQEECEILAANKDGAVHRVSTDLFWRKDGTSFPVEYASTPIYKKGYTIGGVVVTFMDVTDRKHAEEEKRRLEERLQRAEKMEALGQLAGGVAHDLNNVLGILSGYSELLLEKIPEGNQARGYVEKILQSTEKGAAIIQDLLTLARRGVTASEVLNLNGVVSDFFKTPVFEKLKGDHPRVTFRTACDPSLLNIKGSPVHLEKMLMNLVSNAAESIFGEGEVTIRTESRYLDTPLRGYDEANEGDYAVLTVSDTGIGIPEENIEKIFEPFYTRKTMGKSGTGLGLSIVWGTVKDHNGYIDVQTEVGQGTAFTLYFPVTREEVIALQKKELIEQYMGNGESILVVDDIAGQREVAANLFTRLGYEVHMVSSGEEAVEYLKGNKADILVLDMIMTPGIDGLETYQKILEISPKQKAIIVSGFSETERVKEAQRLGAGAYVRKPYVMETIGVAIRDELDKNR